MCVCVSRDDGDEDGIRRRVVVEKRGKMWQKREP